MLHKTDPNMNAFEAFVLEHSPYRKTVDFLEHLRS
jgi:hypothetical protein